jgi:hypothetical protein
MRFWESITYYYYYLSQFEQGIYYWSSISTFFSQRARIPNVSYLLKVILGKIHQQQMTEKLVGIIDP